MSRLGVAGRLALAGALAPDGLPDLGETPGPGPASGMTSLEPFRRFLGLWAAQVRDGLRLPDGVAADRILARAQEMEALEALVDPDALAWLDLAADEFNEYLRLEAEVGAWRGADDEVDDGLVLLLHLREAVRDLGGRIR